MLHVTICEGGGEGLDESVGGGGAEEAGLMY